jgi:23S rRNA-/tRNA-specific pseudouridylate synthase
MVLPLQDWIVYKDERIIILNKPAGIAVQGGTGVVQSVDDSLPGSVYSSTSFTLDDTFCSRVSHH